MREHWIKYQVKDIIEGLFDGPHATPAPSEEGPVFFGVKNLTEDGRLDLSEIRHIAEADFPRWTKRVLPQNDDIVFTYEASLHRYGLLKNDLRCCLGRRMALLRLDKSIVDPQFLLYFFLSSEWKQTVEQNIIVGATVNRIPISDVPSFELSLPSLEEQTKIAEVLAGIDAKIDLNNRINAELEAMAKLLYDYWFVQFDFPISAAYAASVGRPDLAGKPYKSSGGKMVYNKRLKREIPEGWENGNIMSLANLLGGGTPKTTAPTYWDGNIPFFTPSDVEESIFVTVTKQNITETGLRNCSTKLFSKGTIFITARGTVGKVNMASQNMAMNQSCYALQGKEHVNPQFLFFYTNDLVHHIKSKASGSIFKAIVSNDFRLTELVVPPNKIIQSYGDFAKPLFEKILSNKLENQQLIELRDWLLPMLMNGQVALK